MNHSFSLKKSPLLPPTVYHEASLGYKKWRLHLDQIRWGVCVASRA